MKTDMMDQHTSLLVDSISHLLSAADSGDIAMPTAVLRDDRNRVHALHLACYRGHLQVVQLLLESNCQVDVCTQEGLRPLHYATCQGHTDIVRALIAAGANVNSSQGAKGQTPLIIATERGFLDCVHVLLEAGASVNAPTETGMTPLSIAALNDYQDIVFVLLKHGACVNYCDKQCNLPLHYAVRNGNSTLAEALLSAGSQKNTLNKNFETVVHIAVKYGHLSVLQLLIQNGCDVNFCEPMGNVTPLHVAVSTHHDANLFRQLLQLLLHGGCILNWRAFSTLETPLYHSLDHDKEDISCLLLSHGSNPNLASPFDITALEKSCKNSQVRLVNMMLNCGINWKRERWLQHYSLCHGEVTNRSEINMLLKTWKTEVISLQVQCRITIRRILEEGLEHKLSQIPIPEKMRDYILLRDIL